jgi:hypothetical protein
MEKHNYVRLVVEFHSLPEMTLDQVSRLRAAVEQALKGVVSRNSTSRCGRLPACLRYRHC